MCVCVCVCVCVCYPPPSHTTTQEELRAEYYLENLPKQAQTFPAANAPLQPIVLTPVASHSGTRALPPLPPPSASLRAPSPAGSAFVCCKCVVRVLVIVSVCVWDELERPCKAAHVRNHARMPANVHVLRLLRCTSDRTPQPPFATLRLFHTLYMFSA